MAKKNHVSETPATAWLKAQGVPVLIADHSWRRLYRARQAELPVYYGEILSEAAEHSIELERFGAIIAATENDAYNALVCTDFGPEFGRHNVFQLGRADERAADPRSLPSTLGGRTLLRSGSGFDDLNRRIASGWTITKTRLTDGFTLDDYLAQRAEDAEFIARVSPSGVVAFSTTEDGRPKAGKGDTILNFSPPKPAKEPSA